MNSCDAYSNWKTVLTRIMKGLGSSGTLQAMDFHCPCPACYINLYDCPRAAPLLALQRQEQANKETEWKKSNPFIDKAWGLFNLYKWMEMYT